MPPMGHLLGAPLVGFNVIDQRSEAIGNRQWLAMWSPRTEIPAGQAIFVVRVNGKHFENVVNQNQIVVTSPTDSTPEVSIIQLPPGFTDPGFFPSHFFAETSVPSNIVLEWFPPPSVANIKFYRIYWDNGTGTVGFTDADVYDEVIERGAPKYTYVTRELTPGLYKFVIRAVSIDGEVETTNVNEISDTTQAYPPPISGESLTYDSGTKKATLAWTNPGGATAVDIFSNAPDLTKQFPAYASQLTSLGAVTTFVTAALSFPAVHVFGIRVKDASRFELNTSIMLKLRLDALGIEIAGFPPTPFLSADNEGSGKVLLVGAVDQNPDDKITLAKAVTIKFYTDDGAGGPIDFVTPIATETLIIHPTVRRAEFLAGPFGSTARKFSAVALTAGGIESEQAAVITITPNTTVPPVPLTPTATAGRC